MSKEGGRAHRIMRRLILAMAVALTIMMAVLLISFLYISSGVRMNVTKIHLDATQARERVLLGADAALEGLDASLHGLSVAAGHCDVRAGEEGHERVLRSRLVSATPLDRSEVRFTFEIEHGSHSEIVRALELGSMTSLACYAELVVDVCRTGFKIRHAYEAENLISAGRGALLTAAQPHELGSRMRLTSGPVNVSWPTLARPNLAVGAEHHLEVAVRGAASSDLLLFLKRVPIHIKADISYMDSELRAVEVNASVDSALQLRLEGQEPDATVVLSLPIHSLVFANSRLATALVSGLQSSPARGTFGQPPRSMRFKASSPTSPLASAFGDEHTVGFHQDPEMPSDHDVYKTLWGHGRSLSRALREQRRSGDLRIQLNQLLTVDNDTVARVDANVSRDESSETFVDLSFVFRRPEEGWLSSRLDRHQDLRADATAVSLALQFNEGRETAAATGDLQLLQNWSGGRPQVQQGQNASNDTLVVALALNTSKQFLQVSVGWTEHGVVHAGNASAISTSAYSFTSTVDLDGEDGHGGFGLVRFEGPDLRMSFNWTKWEPSTSVEEHALSFEAVRPPGRSVYLGELSTPSPAPAPAGARRLQGGSWYQTTSYHGVDMTCGAASANRWVAQENGFGSAIAAGMKPGGNPRCFAAGPLAMSMSCNASSGAMLFALYMDPFCFMQLMPPSGAPPLCMWDAANREFAKQYCVSRREDLPSEATLHMQDGQILKPGMNTTQGNGYVPPPKSGFADTLMVEAGVSTSLKVTVDRTAADAVVVSGELVEENPCSVKEDSEYEAAMNARWLPPGFAADDPQCRICPMGMRGFLEWINGAGQKEVLDYCIPARFTSSCCKASTWEETLNPTLDGLDMQMNGRTPILGSTSWDRTKRLRMSGNWSSVGSLETGSLIMAEDAQSVPFGMSIRWESKPQGGKIFSGELRDHGLTVLSASFTTVDEQDRIGLSFNLSASSEDLHNTSNATIVAGSALWDTAEERHGIDGFLAAASASVVSSGELSFHANAAAHYVSQALSTGLQLSAAISTPEPLLGLEAAMTYTDSDGRSLLAAFARVNGSDGKQASFVQVQTASDASALICSGTASDDRGRLLRVDSTLAKSAQGGDLSVELQEEGTVTATATGRLQRRDAFYAGEVDLHVHGKPDTFRLAVNASDGFLPALTSQRGYKELYASISGATDVFQGSLVVRAEADSSTSGLAGFGWDVQLSELLADGGRLDRLDGTSFWEIPHSRRTHSPPLATTTPLPMQGAATLLVLKMPVEDFEAVGAAGLTQRVAAAVGATAEVVALNYEVGFAYAVSTTVTRGQAEQGLAVLTGLHTSAIIVGISHDSGLRSVTRGSRITAILTTQDHVIANNVLMSASNLAAIEASHTLQGASGTASAVQAPTVAARVSIRVATSPGSAGGLAAFRQQLQVAVGSAHTVSVIPMNTTGGEENRISRTTTRKLSVAVAVVAFLSLATLAVPLGS